MKPRSIIYLIIKIFFLLIIFYYLYKNNYIDFKNLISTIFKNLDILLLISFIGILTIFFANLRWIYVLKILNLNFSFWKILKITYIGIFFNNVLLGAYGGDLARIYYSLDLANNSKKKIFFSILIDRFFGFIGLALISLVFFFHILNLEIFFNLINTISSNKYYFIILTLIVLVTFFLLNYFYKKNIKSSNFKFFIFLKLNILNIIYILIISVLIFLIINLMIFMITNSVYNFEISLNVIFFTNSIALFSNSIPLTPGGIGLAELTYAELLNLFDEYNKNLLNLSNVYLIFRIINLVISLPGIIIFIMYKKHQ